MLIGNHCTIYTAFSGGILLLEEKVSDLLLLFLETHLLEALLDLGRLLEWRHGL